MASDLGFAFNYEGEQVDIASWLGETETLLDLPEVQFGEPFAMSSPEGSLSSPPTTSPASPFSTEEYLNPTTIFDFNDMNWQKDLFEPSNPAFVDETVLQQLQDALQDPNQGCPSPQTPESPQSPCSSSSNGSNSEGETTNKKKRSYSEIDMDTEVSLPRSTLLAMSSKEIEEYASKIKQQRPLTVAEEKEFKRQRRLIKNREYASQSRNRKKAYVDDIEKKMSDVVAENAALKEQLQSLAQENRTLQKQVDTVAAVLKRAPAAAANALSRLTTVGRPSGVTVKTATLMAVMFMVFTFGAFIRVENGVPTASPTSMRSFPPSRILLDVVNYTATIPFGSFSSALLPSTAPSAAYGKSDSTPLLDSIEYNATTIFVHPAPSSVITPEAAAAMTPFLSFLVENASPTNDCQDNRCEQSLNSAATFIQFEEAMDHSAYL